MKINVIDDKGVERNADIITSFRFDKKSYVIYSFNEEEDDSRSVRVYISELRIKNDSFSFNNIINDSDWKALKDLMKDLAKGISNIDYVLSNYDIEVIDIKNLILNKEYLLATIKDSKIVKVSPKFISGLFDTYNMLLDSYNQTTKVKNNEETEISKKESDKTNQKSVSIEDPSKKMQDIWEYSSMLQKKIAKDMESLNSKMIRYDGKRYFVKVKDPLYFKEKLDLKENVNNSIDSVSDDILLKELEPINDKKEYSITPDKSDLFGRLEKELSGINNNFNKMVIKKKEEKERITNEFEKRLQNLNVKEKELLEFEESLNDRKDDLDKREKQLDKREDELDRMKEELLLANDRLEDNVRSLTRYANMLNSVMLNKDIEEE